MKLLALAAIAIVAAQDEATDETEETNETSEPTYATELTCADGECVVRTTADDETYTETCVVEADLADDQACYEEEESSSALSASIVTFAMAALLMQ